MKYLLACWDVVAVKIREAKHILLLIDYDGTLTPIVERPELAYLSLEVKECLQGLAGVPYLTLGIISGRTLEDLQERVGINGIIYVGNHGLEIEGPGVSFVNPAAKQEVPLLHSLWQDIDKAIADIRGARIDNKGLTLSLHYRLVDEAQLDELNHIFNEMVKSPLASGQIRVTPSKKAYDIRPAVDWDKGKAMEFIAKKLNGRNKPLMLFLGDDVTDYDGFRLANRDGGISIFVGDTRTNPPAQYFLHSPIEVYQLLGMLIEVLSVR
ncbi:MAG TPA: trehalose-phosphatase [Dehalococcoidia bacterium]|nr:trehalose-phosphatase [Dehalococcoidia bacterium]